MSFLDKIFGRKSEPSALAADLPPQRSVEELRKDPSLICVFDKYGRELFITKEEWRKSVLPGAIQSKWNDPDQLYGVILGALNDGFRADIVDAARRLYDIDPQHTRGACLWGIVLMEEGRLDEAEKVFRAFIAKHGEEGVVLTNLAKVFAKRNDDAKAEENLWHALELDPNQDSAFAWYEAIHRERGGEAAGEEAMRQVAALPGSWRAQVWLARVALKAQDLEQAIALYHESLARVGKPIPGDLLMQISGDLGNAGHLPEIIQLAEPHFDAALHGLTVGNNLIKAHLDLGQIEDARRILDQLYVQKRPDWKGALGFWDTEIAKARVSADSASSTAQLHVGMLAGEGPIWLKPTSPAAKFFSVKPDNSVAVYFLGGTIEASPRVQRVERQLADAPGRLSRAVPLFLAEQVEFASCARTRTLVPWVTEPSGGFALYNVAWKDEDAAKLVQRGEHACSYVVTTHLKTQVEPWVLEVRLVRTSDGNCLGQLSESFLSAAPSDAVLRLAQNLLALLTREDDIVGVPVPSAYALPGTASFPCYLLRLEQLLAVRCSGMEGVAHGFLSGEREIVEGNIDQCLQTPHSVSVRLLLAQTLVSMKRVRPDILLEFKDRIKLLQDEHPLIEAAQYVAQTIIDEALAT